MGIGTSPTEKESSWPPLLTVEDLLDSEDSLDDFELLHLDRHPFRPAVAQDAPGDPLGQRLGEIDVTARRGFRNGIHDGVVGKVVSLGPGGCAFRAYLDGDAEAHLLRCVALMLVNADADRENKIAYIDAHRGSQVR